MNSSPPPPQPQSMTTTRLRTPAEFVATRRQLPDEPEEFRVKSALFQLAEIAAKKTRLLTPAEFGRPAETRRSAEFASEIRKRELQFPTRLLTPADFWRPAETQRSAECPPQELSPLLPPARFRGRGGTSPPRLRLLTTHRPTPTHSQYLLRDPDWFRIEQYRPAKTIYINGEMEHRYELNCDMCENYHCECDNIFM